MNKKTYYVPSMDVTELAVEDVLTASNNGDTGSYVKDPYDWMGGAV